MTCCCDYSYEFNYQKAVGDLYLGGVAESGSGHSYSVRRRFSNQWNASAGTVWSLAEDQANGLWALQTSRVQKISADTGTIGTSFAHGATGAGSGIGIAVDDVGGDLTVAAGFNAGNTVTVKRFTPAGALLWSADSHATLPLGQTYTSRGPAMCVINDAAGNSIVGEKMSIISNGHFHGSVTALDQSGAFLWAAEFDNAFTLSGSINCLAISPGTDIQAGGVGEGNIYVGGATSNTEQLHLLDRFGNIIWSKKIDSAPTLGGLAIRAVAVDRDENVYAISPTTLASYDVGGTLRWSESITAGQSLTITRGNVLYVCRGSGAGIYRYNLDGTGATLIESHGAQILATEPEGGRVGVFGW